MIEPIHRSGSMTHPAEAEKAAVGSVFAEILGWSAFMLGMVTLGILAWL